MAVIIRLQRLPWAANAADIREFFKSLHIPEGGVHIVGGRDGDAFIAFGSDEDARMAMKMDGRRIKDTKVKLMLSSRTEMQKVIDSAKGDYQATFTEGSRRRSRSRSRSREKEQRSSSSRRKRSRSPLAGRDRPPAAAAETSHGTNTTVTGFSSFPGHSHPAASAVSTERDTFISPTQTQDQPPIWLNQPPAALLKAHSAAIHQPREQPSRAFDEFRTAEPQLPERRPPLDQERFSMNDLRAEPLAPHRPDFPRESVPQNGRHLEQGVGRMGASAPSHMPDRDIFARNEQTRGTDEEFYPQRQHMDIRPPGEMRGQPRPQLPGIRRDRTPLLPLPSETEKPPPAQNRQEEMPNRDSDSRRPMGSRHGPQLAPIYHQKHSENWGSEKDAKRQSEQLSRSDEMRPGMTQSVRDNLDRGQFGEGPRQLSPRFEQSQMGIPPPVPPSGPPPPGMGFPPPFGFSTQSAPNVGPNPGLFPNFQTPLPMPPLEQTQQSECAVLSRLPVDLQNYYAIKELFNPLFLDQKDIKMVFGSSGEHLGMAYIRFHCIADCRQALTRDGHLGIRIRACSRKDFEEADTGPTFVSDSFSRSMGSQRSRFVIEMGNLPYRFDKRDMERMLDPLRVVPMRMRKVLRIDGSPSDRWLVEFESREEAEGVLNHPQLEVRGRPVHSTRASSQEMDELEGERGFSDPPRTLSPWKEQGSRSRSRPRSPEKRRSRERSRHREHSPKRRKTPSREGSSELWVHVSNMPQKCSSRDVEEFLSNISIHSNGIHNLGNGVAFVELSSVGDWERSLRKDGERWGSVAVRVQASSKQAYESAKKHAPSAEKERKSSAIAPSTEGFSGNSKKPVDPGPAAPHPPSASAEPATEEIDPAVVLSIGQPGAVVVIHGLPPRISLEELCQFFGSFRIVEDSVRMHYNDLGEPTGDCLLAFSTVDDAAQACAKLNRTQLAHYTITLAVVQVPGCRY